MGVDQSAQLKRIRPGSWADVLILAVVPTCAWECRFVRVIRVLDPSRTRTCVAFVCWRENTGQPGNLPRSRLALVSAGWRYPPQRGALADLPAPIALQSTLFTLRTQVRLRTATRNACSASQNHAAEYESNVMGASAADCRAYRPDVQEILVMPSHSSRRAGWWAARVCRPA